MPSTIDDFATQVGADMKALRYDSGLRNVTSLAGDKITSGSIYLRRRRDLVTFRLHVVVPSGTMTSGGTILTIPSGFRRPERWDGWIPASTTTQRSAYMFAAGGFGIYLPTTSDSLRLDLTWVTNDPAPAPGTEPGSAA